MINGLSNKLAFGAIFGVSERFLAPEFGVHASEAALLSMPGRFEYVVDGSLVYPPRSFCAASRS